MGAFQRSQDTLKHCGRRLQYLIVPKSQHTKPLLFNVTIAQRIMCPLLVMLSTVEFNHQLRLEAREIGDVAPDRNLPPRSVPAQLSTAYETPQAALRLRCLVPQRTGSALANCVTHG